MDQNLQKYLFANNDGDEKGYKNDMSWTFIQVVAGIECGIEKKSIKAKMRENFKEEDEENEEDELEVDEMKEYLSGVLGAPGKDVSDIKLELKN